jgi:hypothetical protein
VVEEKGTDRRLFMRFVVVQADIHELALGGDQKIEGGCTNWLLKSANHLIEILPVSQQDHSKKCRIRYIIYLPFLCYYGPSVLSVLLIEHTFSAYEKPEFSSKAD